MQNHRTIKWNHIFQRDINCCYTSTCHRRFPVLGWTWNTEQLYFVKMTNIYWFEPHPSSDEYRKFVKWQMYSSLLTKFIILTRLVDEPRFVMLMNTFVTTNLRYSSKGWGWRTSSFWRSKVIQWRRPENHVQLNNRNATKTFLRHNLLLHQHFLKSSPSARVVEGSCHYYVYLGGE
jgi:hypothetical protein